MIEESKWKAVVKAVGSHDYVVERIADYTTKHQINKALEIMKKTRLKFDKEYQFQQKIEQELGLEDNNKNKK